MRFGSSEWNVLMRKTGPRKSLPKTPVNAQHNNAKACDSLFSEIVESERKYVKQLRTLCHGFLEPMQEQSHEIEELDDWRIRLFIADMKVLLQIHQAFLEELLESAPQDIGFIFVHSAPFFNMYIHLSEVYGIAVEILRHLHDHNPNYRRLAASCLEETQSNNVSLSSMLILPIQRIPRYILLLKRVVKLGLMKESLKAMELIEGIASRMNLAVRDREDLEKVYQLENQFFRDPQISLMGRRLVLEAEVKAVYKDGTVHTCCIHLLNDTLLCSEPLRLVGLRLISRIALRECHLHTGKRALARAGAGKLDAALQQSLLLISPSFSFALSFESVEEMRSWAQTFDKTKASLLSVEASSSPILMSSSKQCASCDSKLNLFTGKRRCRTCKAVFCRECRKQVIRGQTCSNCTMFNQSLDFLNLSGFFSSESRARETPEDAALSKKSRCFLHTYKLLKKHYFFQTKRFVVSKFVQIRRNAVELEFPHDYWVLLGHAERAATFMEAILKTPYISDISPMVSHWLTSYIHILAGSIHVLSNEKVHNHIAALEKTGAVSFSEFLRLPLVYLLEVLCGSISNTAAWEHEDVLYALLDAANDNTPQLIFFPDAIGSFGRLLRIDTVSCTSESAKSLGMSAKQLCFLFPECLVLCHERAPGKGLRIQITLDLLDASISINRTKQTCHLTLADGSTCILHFQHLSTLYAWVKSFVRREQADPLQTRHPSVSWVQRTRARLRSISPRSRH